MRYVLALLIAGCGFQRGGLGASNDARATTDGEPSDASANDAEVLGDAPAVASCLPRWLDGTIRFGTAVAIASVNSTSWERDPYMPDELTMFVSSGRSGTVGNIYRATRTTSNGAFGTPVVDAVFSSAGNETKVSMTQDGLIAMVGSDRATGAGGVDVWEATRASTSDTFGAFTRTRLALVNTSGDEHDPTISANGLRLYLAPYPGSPPQRIVVATRASVSVAFSAPVAISQLNTSSGEADPTLSADERIIVFSSNRTLAGAGGGNIWYAVRANANATFGTPAPVPDVNTDMDDGDPHMSSDGCRLYFGRDIGAYDWEIFVATAQ